MNRLLRLNLVFTTFLLLASSITAQVKKITIEDKIESSEVIIEGMVMSQESYWNDDRTRIFTSNFIEVTNTFKGSTSSLLEIITQGGVVESDFQIIPHAGSLNIGEEGLFLCKNFKNKGSRHQLLMLNGEYGFIKYNKSPDKNELLEIHGCKSSKGHIQERLLERALGFEIEFDSPTLSFFPITAIEFGLDDIQIAADLSYAGFNIMAKSNIDGLQFAGGDVIMKYSSDLFGEYVVTNQNVTTIKGSIIEGPIYTLSKTDTGKDTMKLEVDVDCEDYETMYSLSTEFEEFCNVKLMIQNYSGIGNISLDDFGMQGNVYYYDRDREECTSFDNVITFNPIDLLLMPMVDTFYPDVITTGTGDILTIKGTLFGTTKGKVSFPNADNDGITMTEAKDIDVVWSDTLITVRMPSTPRAAGSGKFKVKTSALLETITTNSLDIQYGVINTRIAATEKPYRVHLTGGSFDNIVFFYEDTLTQIQASASSPIVSIIELALKKWQCNTGVKWSVLGEVEIPIHTSDPDDLINFIYMADTTEFPGALENRVAYNVLNGHIDQCNNGELRYFVTDMDIVLNETANWWYDTTAINAIVPDSTIDFQSIILHEFGHTHKLTHVREFNKVMYYELDPGQSRRILNPLDIAGGLNVIDSSQNLAGCGTGTQSIIPIGQEFPTDCGALPVNEVSALDYFMVYPTVFQDNITIEMELVNAVNLKIRLFDVLGREVLIKDLGKTISGYHQITLETGNIQSKGLYFLQAEIGNDAISKKILKL